MSEYKYPLSLIAVTGRESGLLDPQNANESFYSYFLAVESLSLIFFSLSPICSGPGLDNVHCHDSWHAILEELFGHYGEQYGVSCMTEAQVLRLRLIFRSRNAENMHRRTR